MALGKFMSSKDPQSLLFADIGIIDLGLGPSLFLTALLVFGHFLAMQGGVLYS